MFEKASFIFTIAVQIPKTFLQDETAIISWLTHEVLPVIWRFQREANHPLPYAGVNWKYPVEELLQKYFGKTTDELAPIDILLQVTITERITLHSLRPGDDAPQWLHDVFTQLEALSIKSIAFGKAFPVMGS